MKNKPHSPHKPHSSVRSVPSDPSDIFKFRVWDDVNERYLPTCDIAIDGDFRVYLWDREYEEWLRYSGKLIFEQCTGLIDKTGQLIYEGDIIRFDGWPGTPSHIVAWNPRTCRWVLRLPKDINLENTASLCLGDVADNEYIIIGNIHTSATPSSAPSVPIRTNPYPSVSVRAANQEPLP